MKCGKKKPMGTIYDLDNRKQRVKEGNYCNRSSGDEKLIKMFTPISEEGFRIRVYTPLTR